MIEPGRWSRLGELLARAWQAEPAERDALVASTSGDDPELGEQLEAFLAAGEASSLLDRPVGELAGELLAGAPEDEFETGKLGAGSKLGPFEIRRLLGAGGMGEVFEALDTRLDRPVALKLLPPWIRSPQAKERLLREARAVSALDHPNICTLHDIGESEEGRLYLVMSFYPGETLEQLIARGPLPLELARSIACQIGRGLARAHQAGIIHRDIKPANVILTEQGEAKILDFGIARVSGERALTATGGRTGTPAYMSPEQASGGEVGQATDIWSLGVVLYEMLTGRHPFPGEDPQAVIHGILNRTPTSSKELRPDLTPDLEAASQGALAKAPKNRFASAEDLLKALGGDPAPSPTTRKAKLPWRWAAAAGALVGLLWLGSQLWQGRHPTSPPPPAAEEEAGDFLADTPMIAVLPFTNHSGQLELDWYGEGLAQLVSDGLATSRHLRVASARRTQSLLEQPAGNLEAAALADGIDFVLTGELLPSPDGYQLAARVTSTREQRQVASHGAEAVEPRQLLSAADEVALAARRALGAPLEESIDVFAADFASGNPEAYEHYLEGLRAYSDYRFEEAAAAFDRALAEAPDFTMALYRRAYMQALMGHTEVAQEGMTRAVEAADGLPDREARYVRAALAYIERRYDDAIEAYEEILEHYPYETEARSQLVVLFDAQGRREEQLEFLDVLARLAPEDPAVWNLSGEIRLGLGQFQQAMLDLSRYAELAPDSANAHHSLGNAYRAQGQLALAASEYQRAVEVDPGFGDARVDLAVIDLFQDRPAQAEQRLEDLIHDADAVPRHRIRAAFALAALRRSRGRFAASLRPFEELAEEIAEESVREAWALSVGGSSRMELGRLAEARGLLESAVARSPVPVATRYLYARGLLEVREQRWQGLDRTVAAIQAGALPPDDPDRGAEEKAAASLQGLRALREGEVSRAIQDLELAVALEGYAYRIYRLDLGRAYLAAGRFSQALAAGRQTLAQRDLAKPRLDLELDRARARLLVAQVHEAMGDREQAARLAQAFLSLWSGADSELADLAEAERLARFPHAD